MKIEKNFETNLREYQKKFRGDKEHLKISLPQGVVGMAKKSLSLILVLSLLILLSSCASTSPTPDPLSSYTVAPVPVSDNSGTYMCPYTQDGVVAQWCDKAINASIGGGVGKVAGSLAGSHLLEKIPFVGSLFGAELGEAAGRAIAIKASGGWDYIKETSDQSFNSIDDLKVWMYVTYSKNEHYEQVLKSVRNIYPEFN